MTQPINSSQIGEFMSRHFAQVFMTLLSMPSALSRKTDVPAYASQVTGSVGFAGESMSGALCLRLSESLARRAATAMLGLPAERLPDPAEIIDTVGEVSNQLAGGLASWFCEAGAVCVRSTPLIIRGKAYSIDRMADVDRTILVFECGEDFVVVEMHLRQD